MRVKYIKKLNEVSNGETGFVFNATRPINGHKAWTKSVPMAGLFFASVDPQGEFANEYLQRLEEMDAALVLEMPTPDQMLADVQAYADRKGYDVDIAKWGEAKLIDAWYSCINRTKQKI